MEIQISADEKSAADAVYIAAGQLVEAIRRAAALDLTVEIRSDLVSAAIHAGRDRGQGQTIYTTAAYYTARRKVSVTKVINV